MVYSKIISSIFASKFDRLLNIHHSKNLYSSIHSLVTESLLSAVEFSEKEVCDALCQLKPNKSDSYGISTEHLKFAPPVIAEPLASLFTSIVRHDYMPQCLRDSVLVPIPKGNKDPSHSQNYRAIVLTSSLSKYLERLILDKYSAYLYSSAYQFGFESGFSTSLCTGMWDIFTMVLLS